MCIYTIVCVCCVRVGVYACVCVCVHLYVCLCLCVRVCAYTDPVFPSGSKSRVNNVIIDHLQQKHHQFVVATNNGKKSRSRNGNVVNTCNKQ